VFACCSLFFIFLCFPECLFSHTVYLIFLRIGQTRGVYEGIPCGHSSLIASSKSKSGESNRSVPCSMMPVGCWSSMYTVGGWWWCNRSRSSDCHSTITDMYQVSHWDVSNLDQTCIVGMPILDQNVSKMMNNAESCLSLSQRQKA
jgi:hypothetical protein